MKTKHKKFMVVSRKRCPSGAWDNGRYTIDPEHTVSVPVEALARAFIVHYPDGFLKGVRGPCSRIDVDGKSYLVAGDVKS